MTANAHQELTFNAQTITARFIDPGGNSVERKIEIRTNPITGRRCRITYSRSKERETGVGRLPDPPPNAANVDDCPFCRPQIERQTPRLDRKVFTKQRLRHGDSLLFPNLFPYGAYSAVSLFDNRHFVEIGKASLQSYKNSLVNCTDYLQQVVRHDPKAVYLAITQNHLPSAGGSLVHPHLQVHADRIPTNHHACLYQRALAYHRLNGRLIFGDYLRHEKETRSRFIGWTGSWAWMAAYAPKGFYEIWGILPGVTSLMDVDSKKWENLSRGILCVQKFYRHLNRNGYNLGLISIVTPENKLELRVSMLVRSNYAPWVRSDHTGFEVMLGDMATFTAPEETARMARPFWGDDT
jgi:galactose-1-phosphate uridylyltransferase